MIVSGQTTHKLDIIKTYNKSEPYKVGVNGVTKIENDPISGNINKVYYNLNGIEYVTKLINLDTTFKYNPDDFERGLGGGETYLREEGKIGLIFEPKTNNQIFIERDLGAILERHSRLSEINNLDDLEDYLNGYYYVKKEI